MLTLEGKDAWCKVPMVFGYGEKHLVVRGFNGSVKMVGTLNVFKFKQIELLSIVP